MVNMLDEINLSRKASRRIRLFASLALASLLVTSTAWAEMLSVAVDRANFREAPSTKAAILYTADKYYSVEVLERKDDWIKTRDFEGDIAWVAAFLVEKRDSVVISVPTALVRKSPDKNSPVVFKADRGEGMRVILRQGQWINVASSDGMVGWVHREVVWVGQ